MGFIRSENYVRHVENCQGVKDFTCGNCHKGFDRYVFSHIYYLCYIDITLCFSDKTNY